MPKGSATLVGIILAVLLIAGGIWYWTTTRTKTADYAPMIIPSEFSTTITNRLFMLTPGKQWSYQGRVDEGTEKIEVVVTDQTKELMGVQTVVYWDRVWLNDVLVENTRDYLAQHQNGDVWYFGEEVDNYENGQLKDHAGSWLAGVDGAQPGIWMPANPQVGDTYRQEYAKDTAEDMGEIISLNEAVTIGNATYTDCLKTYDTTPLDANAREHKYYCPEVGGITLEVDLVSGDRSELVNVISDSPERGGPAD